MIGKLMFLATLHSVAFAGIAVAQESQLPVREEQPGLLGQAKISPDSARCVALGAMRGATLNGMRIGHDNEVLVYRFDMSYRDVPGRIFAEVDAKTGKFLRARQDADDLTPTRDTLAAKTPKSTLVEGAPDLLREATVSPDSARAVALETIRGGVIRSARISRDEDGLVYWFGMSHPRFPGPIHAAVDAMTGRFIRAWQSLPGSASAGQSARAQPMTETLNVGPGSPAGSAMS
ncbi:MAG: PepSY domain-containing protein [Gemmatimonadota bacterium]